MLFTISGWLCVSGCTAGLEWVDLLMLLRCSSMLLNACYGHYKTLSAEHLLVVQLGDVLSHRRTSQID